MLILHPQATLDIAPLLGQSYQNFRAHGFI
jgi:hypothetical protein